LQYAPTFQEDNLKRARELFQAGAKPEQEMITQELYYNNARHQLEGAQAQLEAAQARLALLQAGSREQTIERLTAANRTKRKQPKAGPIKP